MRVWAPRADTVAVRTDGVDTPMTRALDGWWEVPDLPGDTDYAFLLDGAGPYPDPRSPRQPDGVHGPSRTFDAAFAWTDADWPGRDVRGAVLYELHVGTFTPEGTLDAAIERLPHLVTTGVDLVQLMPVAAFNGRWGWGYDGVDLYAVHEAYGGPRALQRFVDAAHAAGLGVVLDVVYNHLGPSGNYLGVYGPYFSGAHHTPWGEAVNFAEPAVRAFVVDNALRWLRDFHVDGLRLDAVHEMHDDSPVHILAQLSEAVAGLARELGRPLSLVAESDLNDVTMVTPVAEGGLGMTAQWDDDVHHAVHAWLTGERQGYYSDFGSLRTVAKALGQVFVHNGEFSSFRGRTWGAPVPAPVDRHRFVASTQTHDQVGNRPLGDRPTLTLSEGAVAIEAALLLTSPFTPMLFMGEEWAARTPFRYFSDHPEPELAQAVREGRRREFGDHAWAAIGGGDPAAVPDPQDPATMTASRLDWSEPDLPDRAAHLTWVRRLIALRRERAELRDGASASTRVRLDEGAGWLVIERGAHRVLLNPTADALDVPGELVDPALVVLAAWGPEPRRGADRVTVAAGSAAVIGPA